MQDDIRDPRARHETTEPRAPEPHIGPDHPPPPPKRSTGVRVLVWVVILLLFALLFWWVIRHRQAPAAGGGGRRAAMGGSVTLSTATAKQGSIGVYLDAIGTVTPVYTTTIVSQVTGVINQVRYREGQLVHRGQPLIQIDARPFQANVTTAQGQLERDTNLLAQAQMDLKRYQDAWARNAIPKQTLDDQEKIVLQEAGTVKADQGTLAFDQVQLGFTNITSPITGRVGLRLVDPGNLATASSSTPLAVVTQIQPITVVFTIPEDSVTALQQQMRHGKPLPVDALDRSETTKLGSGSLEATDNQIDTTTGTLKLRAVFKNEDGALFPNQFVNARLLLNTLENVVLIPSSAIQHNGDVSYVFLIQNEVAHIHNIKPGVSESGMTQVEGLNPGDVVADSSFEKLQDGSRIVVSKTRILPSNNESNAP
ncbi:MAG: rane fusion protein multidrug efflux system [Acidobacteriaceae bacterium]|jgi:multidrug efflux system membrane fusion protein|nr:rane fusion protein multidrug efflux system [Acidobacteriaceae bacterium]MDX6460729.1 rane fusion protein multidrug efflux system [Acidobacteriaceae bacterium]